jgi:hypothetical protein
MVTVNYDDLSMAFDFVSSGAPFENRAFVSLETGRIYWVSELNPIDEEELPDDLDEPGRYREIPHKNDFDLGDQLAFRFVREQLPGQSRRVADIFHGRAAYRRFKELLAAEGCLEQWYAFETEATDQALREWCQENDIQLDERKREGSA